MLNLDGKAARYPEHFMKLKAAILMSSFFLHNLINGLVIISHIKGTSGETPYVD